MTRAAVGSDDAWDLQDRAKRVAIQRRVGAEDKIGWFRKRMRKYDCAMPGYREDLLDFERDAGRREAPAFGALVAA